MRPPHSLFKLLSLVLIAALIGLRLSSFTEEVFVVPVEDALFDVPFIAADDGTNETKPLKVKPKRVFDITLSPVVELRPRGEQPLPSFPPATTVLNLKEIHFEIFIPPESIS